LGAGAARQRSRRLPGRAPPRAPPDLRGGLARPELRQHRGVQRPRPGARPPPRRPPRPGRAVPRMTPALSVTARRAGGWRLALVLALAVAVGLPALTNTYYVRLATGILMFAALACGWNLIGGYAGYPDFGAAAFLGMCALAVAGGLALPRLRVGYAIAAIRENQAAAEALGIAPLPYKIVAYSGSAFVFGLVGGVYADWFTFIDPPTVFNVDFAIQAIVMTLFGGPATALGPVAGAIVLKSLDTVLTNVSIFLHNVFF